MSCGANKAENSTERERKLNQRQRDRGKLDALRIGPFVFGSIMELGNSALMPPQVFHQIRSCLIRKGVYGFVTDDACVTYPCKSSCYLLRRPQLFELSHNVSSQLLIILNLAIAVLSFLSPFLCPLVSLCSLICLISIFVAVDLS